MDAEGKRNVDAQKAPTAICLVMLGTIPCGVTPVSGACRSCPKPVAWTTVYELTISLCELSHSASIPIVFNSPVK